MRGMVTLAFLWLALPAAVHGQKSQDTLVDQLFQAVGDRDAVAVRSAVQAGADINASYAEAFPRGASPLGMAALIGSESVAEALIELGADLERADDRGNTALTWAILGKHVAVARMAKHVAILTTVVSGWTLIASEAIASVTTSSFVPPFWNKQCGKTCRICSVTRNVFRRNINVA